MRYLVTIMTSATLYLRLSDFRDDSDGLTGREARLRAEAARLHWDVGRVAVENDVTPAANGRSRPASAFKRVPVRDKAGKPIRDQDTGRVLMRVHRPVWQSIVNDLAARRTGALLCEDLDRAARDPRDLEDLVDAVAATGASARSLSGSLTLTNGGTDSEIAMARVMVAMAAKSSADNARRVTAKRGDLAGAGAYGGGRRPFGYRPDPDAPKYHKTLLEVPAEAAEIRRAADAVMAGTSLKAIARDWRERNVPTVTGAPWSAGTLRDVLMKPALAGLVPADGELVQASWPAILEREVWEAVCAKLTAPTYAVTMANGEEQVRPRKSTTGNEPKHLLSGIARCHCGGPVKIGGGARTKSYVCTQGNHLRRQAAATDALVLAYVAEYIQGQAADLLRPPARPGVDVHALRAEARRITAIGEREAVARALDDVPDGEYRAAARVRKARLAEIAAQLTAVTEPDPLAEFRDQPDAAAVLEALPLPRRRAVVRLLVCVTLARSARRGRWFDPDSVKVTPAAT